MSALGASATANTQSATQPNTQSRCGKGYGWLYPRKAGIGEPRHPSCKDWRNCDPCARNYGMQLGTRWSRVTGLKAFGVLTAAPDQGDWRIRENREALQRVWRRLRERIRRQRKKPVSERWRVPYDEILRIREATSDRWPEGMPAHKFPGRGVWAVSPTGERVELVRYRDAIGWFLRISGGTAPCGPSRKRGSEALNAKFSPDDGPIKYMYFNEHGSRRRAELGRLHRNILWSLRDVPQAWLSWASKHCGGGSRFDISRIGELELVKGRPGCSPAVSYSMKTGRFRVVAYARKTGSQTASSGDDWPKWTRRWSASRAAAAEMGPKFSSPDWGWSPIPPESLIRDVRDVAPGANDITIKLTPFRKLSSMKRPPPFEPTLRVFEPEAWKKAREVFWNARADKK